LNPKKTIEIEEPKKGELVTQKAFDEIMTKKMEQMSEQYNGRESDENTIQIRINN
jgi:C-terminal processing protease CtpA/Prc